MFMSSSRNKITLLYQNSVKMFLLVSVRLVGAHPVGPQHDVSIQISINLCTKYSSGLNLGEGLCIFTSFYFPDSGFYLLNFFDFE